MSDLKAVYDRVLAAQAERDLVINEIDNEMAKGTPEGDQRALELKSKLEEAQNKVNDLDELYTKMKNATSTRVNAQFVPVSETTNQATDDEEKPKTLTLAAYNQLDPRERLSFAKRGGKLEE